MDPTQLPPGLAGYVQAQQQNQAQGMQQMQQAVAAQSLMQHFDERARQEGARKAVAALGPNPTEEQVLQAVAPFSQPQDILRHYSTIAARKESADARRYAADTAAEARRSAEQDRLAARRPTMRNRISGEELIQEEVSPDGQVKEIGRGPRFARSITPAVTTHETSKEQMSDEAVRDLAIQSLYDPNALSGYRRDTTAMSRIANARQKVMKEAGVTSEDVVSGRAGFKADTASLNKITPMYDAITAFEKTAIRNGQVLKDLADKVDSTGTPVIERWVRAGRKSIGGDEDVAKFNAQMTVYRTEAAKILTNPNLTGVLTVDARKEMEHVIDNSASATQIKHVVDLLERDFHNRRQTMEEQIGSIRARMRGRVAPGGGSSGEPAPGQPAPAAAPQPAAGQQPQYPTATAPNGRKVIFKDGRWQPLTQ